MIRKIITLQERTLVLELPEELVGKEVEVLAFEVKEMPSSTEDFSHQSDRLSQIQKTFSKYQVDVSNYDCDRDEANNSSEPDEAIANASKEERIEYLNKALTPCRVDLSNYQFDRDEANTYE